MPYLGGRGSAVVRGILDASLCADCAGGATRLLRDRLAVSSGGTTVEGRAPTWRDPRVRGP